MPRATRLWPLLALLPALLPAGGAHAESSVLLPLPESFGQIEAGTFDATGHRVGASRMSVARRPDGRIELRVGSGIDGDARVELGAVMEVADGGRALRLLSQRSEAFDASGASMGVLSVDHLEGVARCGAGPGHAEASVELPAGDRVVNVPLNLLFQDLATGKRDEVSFQVLLCRFGARLVDARARLAPPRGTGGELLEVRYELDFGPLLNPVAEPFLPTLSVWFDPAHPGAWVAHRMPLFSKGPTVLVVRSGFSPERLAPDVAAGGL
jgi:hypothetical protein